MLFLALITCLLVPFTLFAEPGLDFTATLQTIKFRARPGQVVNRNFRLTLAPTAKRAQFRAHASDWWRTEDGKQSLYAAAGTLDQSCAEWITLNPVEQTISAGETLDIRITTSVPVELAPGGYWCVVNVDQLPDPLAASEGVQLNFLASVSVGVFIYIDPVRQAATITSVDLSTTEAVVTLQNDGNAPFGAEGRLEFVRPNNASPPISIPFERRTVLTQPIRTARLTAALPDAAVLPEGDYVVRAIFDIGLDHYIGVQKRMQVRR